MFAKAAKANFGDVPVKCLSVEVQVNIKTLCRYVSMSILNIGAKQKLSWNRQ